LDLVGRLFISEAPNLKWNIIVGGLIGAMEIHHLQDPSKAKLSSKSIERRITIREEYRSSKVLTF
jgi:hypothetical protein